MNGPLPLPGWYPDPHNSRQVRWWNGAVWTNDTRPVPAPPGSSAVAGSGSWWTTWSVKKAVLVGVGGLLALSMIGNAFGGGETPASVSHAGQRAQKQPAAEPSSAASVPAPAAKPAPPQRVRVPRVQHATVARARSDMRAHHLHVAITRRYSWAPVGTVLSQHTGAGRQVLRGTVVQLVVAKAMPRVPRVVGRTAGAAIHALRHAGFGVRRTTETVTSGTTGSVLRQSPLGLLRARPGAVVTIVVAHVVHPVVKAPPPAPAPSNCTAGYSPCLAPAYDYDCAGGSGDGPKYAYGPIYVTGSDPYGLDADGDGVACES